MANQILRPNGIGHYNNWSGYQTSIPHTPLWELIDEPDADGDTSYVTAGTPSAFTVQCTSAVAGAWPRATRIPSIRVVATVRTTGIDSSYRVRLRLLGNDYDSGIMATASVTYVEQDQVYILTPNAYAWNLSALNRMEVGLVFVAGDPIRCTKLETFIHYEQFPHHTLVPEAAGILQEWTAHPSTSPAYMTVGGIYDGDLSYLEDSTVNHRSLFTITDLPASISPVNIDRVSVKALVKNTGSLVEEADIVVYSGGTYFNGGTNTTSVPIPLDDQWHLLTENFLNDPGIVWPSGDPTASAWTQTQVDALEIGVENAGGGNFRCTSLATEVWLAPTPPTVIDLFPSANGYHTDWTSIVPGAPAWNTVNEDPPDDIASYVSLDADTAGTPVYASFVVAGAGSVPAGERIYNVELRCRVRLDNLPHSQATVVPIIRNTRTPETYVGKPQLIEGIGSTWIDVKWDFHQNPDTGLPWGSLSEVNVNMEYGLGVLDGQMLLSRVRTQVQTIKDYRGSSDVTDMQITDVAETWILRSQTEGIIYGNWEFAVGIGGYDVTDPITVVAVDPTATTLSNEIYRAEVDRIEYDATLTVPIVDYWCRVHQDEAFGGIGEIGLFATVLWSPVPGEAGTKFLYALAHFPCQTRTQYHSNAHFYKLRVGYYDYGEELIVDGDMETAGTAAWTATAATLSKQTTNPYEGTQLLRVAQTGAGTGTASQAILTLGQLYWVQAQARSDGTDTPVIENPSGTAIWIGTTSTSWQPVSLLHIAAGDTSLWLGASGGAATNYAEFDAVSARSVLSLDFLTHGSELVADNDMEAPGAVAWTAGNAAILTKQTTLPYEGTQVLRIAYNGTNNPYAEQTVLFVGTIYHATGFIRSDGTGVPALYDGATLLWTGTTTTDWQSFNLAFTAASTTIRYWCGITGAGYCEVDLVSVKTITPP